jgi:hypothetical protein
MVGANGLEPRDNPNYTNLKFNCISVIVKHYFSGTGTETFIATYQNFKPNFSYASSILNKIRLKNKHDLKQKY